MRGILFLRFLALRFSIDCFDERFIYDNID